MSDTNEQLAAIFSQMADIAEVLGQDRFRVNAFDRAARAIDDLSEDLKNIGSDEKALTDIDGIGEGIAQRIIEFLDNGKIDDHAQLMDQVPTGLPELLTVPGLGPKKVRLIWQDGGIENIEDLKKSLQTDALAKLPGMGKKTLENLRKSLAFTEKSADRTLIGQAMPLAQWIVERLRDVKGATHVTYAGSLRRGRETIGDIDIIVAASQKHAPDIAKTFTQLAPVADILAHGKTKASVRMGPDGRGLQVDLRIVPENVYGAALLYFTGSKQHNVKLRQRAIKMGLKLSEYGLFKDGDDQNPIAAKTEQHVYDALDLNFIPPELREDRGEIAHAQDHDPPNLITRNHMQAELHAHTNASDGHFSIRELATYAADRGLHTIAITDHSKSQVQAHGLDEKRLEEHIEQIRDIAHQLEDKITILAGAEVDILADGRLDYPNNLLKQLDIVVASPHGALSQDPAKATKRLLKAIDNPYVTILGHPTGRLINRRPGLSPDIPQLAKAAAKRNIALEINANSYRLDLRDTHARTALDAGCKLAINTDAHGPGDFDQIIYGLLTARRAGATPADVVNTLDPKPLKKWLQQTRP